MKQKRILPDFLLKEWLFFGALSGIIITSIYLHRFPSYSMHDIEIIFILVILFISVKGLENSGLLYRLYTSIENTDNPIAFTFKFIAIGYAAFIIGIGLYFMIG